MRGLHRAAAAHGARLPRLPRRARLAARARLARLARLAHLACVREREERGPEAAGSQWWVLTRMERSEVN